MLNMKVKNQMLWQSLWKNSNIKKRVTLNIIWGVSVMRHRVRHKLMIIKNEIKRLVIFIKNKLINLKNYLTLELK